MDFGPFIPTLRVASLQTSLAFYVDQLGFSVKWRWSDESRFEPTDAPELACIERGEAVLFLSESHGGSESWLFVELAFVEDVDALADSLRASIDFEAAPADQPWGSREFSLKDPDGHRIRFSCPLSRTRA